MPLEAVLPPGKLQHDLLQSLLTELPGKTSELLIPPLIGCDAAGVQIGNQQIAVTTDPITLASERIGTYSVCVNINDVACLGCRPRWYSASLLLPIGTTEEQLRAIWRDTCEQLAKYKIQSLGGHTEVTAAVNMPVLVGQMIGEKIGETLLDPTQGCPGDRILLWQSPAIEGTALLAQLRYEDLKHHFDRDALDRMQNLLDEPGICIWPFVERLIPQAGLVALHDPTEGGVATALHELADAAGCGLVVDRQAFHICKETLQLAQLFDLDPLGMLASGSLLILCKAEFESVILKKFYGEPLVSIGELTVDPARLLMNDSVSTPLPRYSMDEIIRGQIAQISSILSD